MYSKYKTEKLLDKYGDTLKRALRISGTVTFHVHRSTSKKYINLKLGRDETSKAYTHTNSSGSSDIVIFADRHSSERDVIGTILHELLHARISELTSLVTLNSNKAYRKEEKLVQDLERFFINLFWDKKL